MKIEDVKIGDKVVPFRKTVAIGINGLYSWDDWNNRLSEFFKKNGYVTISEISGNLIWLEETVGCFNISDVEPYIEPVKDNSIKKHVIMGNRTIVYLAGLRKGIATCSPTDTFEPIKGLAIAYARALGQKVEDIEIVVNPQPKTQDKSTLHDEVVEIIKGNKGLIPAIRYYREQAGCSLLETKIYIDKVDAEIQPTKHEVVVDGVRYVEETK